MELLKVVEIEKYYGNKSSLTKAIDGISFGVNKGEFVAIMGASGSGKTTLLNCISTIDRVTAGHIYLENSDITEFRGKELTRYRREKLGFIFQDFNLLDTLTAYENISLALRVVALILRNLRPSVEIAEEHREAQVPRHRQDRSGKCNRKPVTAHILDILKGRKAQRDKGRIDDGVKPIVKGRMMPHLAVHQEILRPLFHGCHDQKSRQNHIDLAGRRNRCQIQKLLGHRLQHDGKKRRKDAPQHQADQQLTGLRLHGIALVDITHQKQGRPHGSDQKDRNHHEPG